MIHPQTPFHQLFPVRDWTAPGVPPVPDWLWALLAQLSAMPEGVLGLERAEPAIVMLVDVGVLRWSSLDRLPPDAVVHWSHLKFFECTVPGRRWVLEQLAARRGDALLAPSAPTSSAPSPPPTCPGCNSAPAERYTLPNTPRTHDAAPPYGLCDACADEAYGGATHLAQELATEVLRLRACLGDHRR